MNLGLGVGVLVEYDTLRTLRSRMRRKSAPVPVGSSVRKFSISVSGRLPMTCAKGAGRLRTIPQQASIMCTCSRVKLQLPNELNLKPGHADEFRTAAMS